MPTFWRFSMKFYEFTTFTFSGKIPSRAEGARKNFGILDGKIRILLIFCRNLLEFERKYSLAVPLSAAGAKNCEFWPYRSQNPTL